MISGDLCSFGPGNFQVTHYRCDDYRDGTVTDVLNGTVVKPAPYSNPMGFDRKGTE